MSAPWTGLPGRSAAILANRVTSAPPRDGRTRTPTNHYDSDDASTDEMLAELGGSGRVEREMLRELAATRMRALEVLSRNGSRPPSQLRPPGPRHPDRPILRPAGHPLHRAPAPVAGGRVPPRPVLAAAGVGSRPGTRPAPVLLKARLDVGRATPAYQKHVIGVPAVLLGGAVVSSLTQGLRSGTTAAGSRIGGRRGPVRGVHGDRRLLLGDPAGCGSAPWRGCPGPCCCAPDCPRRLQRPTSRPAQWRAGRFPRSSCSRPMPTPRSSPSSSGGPTTSPPCSSGSSPFVASASSATPWRTWDRQLTIGRGAAALGRLDQAVDDLTVAAGRAQRAGAVG